MTVCRIIRIRDGWNKQSEFFLGREGRYRWINTVIREYPMKLYIGNKKYSSWSFRPWLAMRAKEVPFEEVLVPFDMAAGNPAFREFSPTGKVPCLVDGNVTVWESLSILEYVAERYPDRGFWPADKAQRARARSVSSEMHAGFSGLRSECPMNMARKHAPLAVSGQVRKDVQRIEEIWTGCLDASGGPYLFGRFTIADAMYAPVVNRLQIYCLSEAPVVAQYTATLQALDAWRQWEQDGRAEPWIVEEDEA